MKRNFIIQKQPNRRKLVNMSVDFSKHRQLEPLKMSITTDLDTRPFDFNLANSKPSSIAHAAMSVSKIQAKPTKLTLKQQKMQYLKSQALSKQ